MIDPNTLPGNSAGFFCGIRAGSHAMQDASAAPATQPQLSHVNQHHADQIAMAIDVLAMSIQVLRDTQTPEDALATIDHAKQIADPGSVARIVSSI